MKSLKMQFIKLLNFIKLDFMMLILFFQVSGVKLFLPRDPDEIPPLTVSLYSLKIPKNIFLSS